MLLLSKKYFKSVHFESWCGLTFVCHQVAFMFEFWWKSFSLCSKTMQLAAIWACKYYCSHITVLTFFSIKFVHAIECVAGSIVYSSYYACVFLWLFDSFILYVLRMPRWMKVTEKCCKKLSVDVYRDVYVFFFKPILRYNLAFVFQGTVGRRNTKLRNESVISLYICVAEPRSSAQPGVSLSFYFKLRSLKSYLCSAFLSITNLINKIANKNRIVNTKFSRRTWQNNACQLLLFTQFMLFSTLSSGLSGQ